MVKTLRRAVCSGSQACNTSLPLPRQHCTLLTAHTAHCTLEKGTVCSGRSWARATEHGQGKPKLSSQKEEEIEGGGKAECQRISPLASTERCDQNHKKSAVQFSYQSSADINLCITFIQQSQQPLTKHLGHPCWSVAFFNNDVVYHHPFSAVITTIFNLPTFPLPSSPSLLCSLEFSYCVGCGTSESNY